MRFNSDNYQGRCRGWCRQQQGHGREWCTQQLGKKIIKLCVSQFHTFAPPEKIASRLTRRDVGVCVEGSRGSSRELLNGGRSCGRGEVVRGGGRGQKVVGGGGGSLVGVVEDMHLAPVARCSPGNGWRGLLRPGNDLPGQLLPGSGSQGQWRSTIGAREKLASDMDGWLTSW